MAGEVKSLFQRLQERRAAVSTGDPTGGESMGARGKNQKPVQKETKPTPSSANLTPAQRRARIKEIEAELARMK